MRIIRSESGVSRMGEFDGLLQGAVRQAQAANQPENGDYYDDEGFLVCGNCHTRRQVEVNMPDLKAVPFDPKKKVRVKMPVSCRCRAERRKQEEQMLMQDREMRAAQALKQQSLMDERLRDISFDGFQQTKDNAYNLKLCLRYAKHFDEMLAKNQGLLFYGGVGTGKTFAAACIANHLLSLRVPVVMTSFVKLLETMQGFSEDDSALIARLNRAKLLIIDDTIFSMENMAPFLTGKKPGIHDDGCTDYCPKPLDGCELVRSYSEHELRSYEEDMREYISQFTDEELMEAYELDRTTLNALAPRAAVLMRKYIDNDDSWTYHRDYAISEVVSEYKEDKDNG